MKKAAAIALAVLLLDQLSKLWVRQALPLGAQVDVLPFFSLVHVQNTGSAFGLFSDANRLFVLITVVILALLARLHRDLAAQGEWAAAGLPFLWGGALGNLADRLWLGSVTDFLDFHAWGWHWWAFNVADSAITVGISCLIVQNFVPRGR